MMNKILIVLLIAILSNIVISQDSEDTIKSNFELPEIDIIGSQDMINRIPGSIFKIGSEKIKLINPLSSNEIFKKVTGVNVVDEEGLGLRLNIGIRGMDPDRSRTILVLEDGIPVSIAPYGEPEMYYTPPIDKMRGVEILKGSGSILFGPQTIGGVINYLTTNPPDKQVLNLVLKGGSKGIFLGKADYGTTYKNIGVHLSIFRKQGDNVGVLKYRISDINAKFKIALSQKSLLGFKFSGYDEKSNSTYVGLTQVMYDRGEYFPIIPENDNVSIRRYSVSMSHKYSFSNSATLTTTAYGYTTDRIWRRQDFSRTSINNPTHIWGDTSVIGGAIFMKNTTGIRDRRFVVAGIEPRLFMPYKLGRFKSELDAGARYHYETANEKRINGTQPYYESGALISEEIRTGNALSGFAQNKLFIRDNFIFTAGLRLESFFFDRTILRVSSRDTNISAKSSQFQIIPGIGISYILDTKYNLFAGIHRGYAPPRIKDAISITGDVTQLDAELSWNYELGMRANLKKGVNFEMTGYLLDFSNQVIPVSVSSGGSGSGLTNGGSTMHIGIETGFSFDIGMLLRSKYNVILSSNTTLGKSTYNSDRYIRQINGQDTVITNVKGNKLPYAPQFNLNVSMEISAPFGLGFITTGNYSGSQFTDELNTINPSNDGILGKISSRFIVDFTARYKFKNLNSSIYLSVKNIFDERYIASRRPQGIKVGLPRIITGGVDFSF